MRITSRGKTIAFFITLGACLVALAVFLNVSWIVYHWRSAVPLVLGIVFFSVIIAGLVVNTIFIVREIRRNERQDTFLNAGQARHLTHKRNWQELNFGAVAAETLELARLRHHLPPEAIRFSAPPP